jgi:hypothetical protein
LTRPELRARRVKWERRGLEIGAFTWRDAQASWPQPIVTDRSLVAEPESLGIKMDAGPDRFAELVLWVGGWADRDCCINGQFVMEPTPRYENVAECVAIAVDLANQLLEGWAPQGVVQ